MKKSSIIIAVCVLALCIAGWATAASGVISQKSKYSELTEKADEYVSRGLYQRAVANYNLALKEKNTAELYEKINTAYLYRYEEAPDDTREEYMDFLEDAVAEYPGNPVLVDSFYDIFYSESRYEDIYHCLLNTVENGNDTEEIRARIRDVKYRYSLFRNNFTGLKQSGGEFFTAARRGKWNVYNPEKGFVYSETYDYAGNTSPEGYVVVTGADSRLYDGKGVVLGIFEEKITEAGIFAEGLIPASADGVYSYYNDFAEKQFGEYEYAGSFTDGKAAVKQNGQWFIINNKGETVSEAFEKISVDYAGRYICGDKFLAKSAGSFGVYDKKGKLVTDLACEDADILTEDGIIAICRSGKWGFADIEGNIVIDPMYTQAKSFSNGIAAVNTDGKWGFADKDNNIVIEQIFTDAGYMQDNGICPVRTDTEEEKSEETTAVSEETATAAPEETTTSAPEETTTAAPEETATAAPEETTTAVPEETATAAPEETATAAPEETTTAAPEGSTATEQTSAQAPSEAEKVEEWKLLRLEIKEGED